jgi:hypothetical protein
LELVVTRTTAEVVGPSLTETTDEVVLVSLGTPGNVVAVGDTNTVMSENVAGTASEVVGPSLDIIVKDVEVGSPVNATNQDTVSAPSASPNIQHLSLNNELLDIVQWISPNSVFFLAQIHGRGIMIPPALYQVSEFVEFSNLMASGDLFKLACSRNDKDTQVLHLHYFAGVNVPHHDNTMSSEHAVKHSAEIHSFIEGYFVNDTKMIKTCVWNARSLYITATSNEGHQEIVACLNYCVLPNKGIFVNWIVVKDDEIGFQLYGGEITFHCGNNNNWRRHKLASLLLQVARIGFVSKMYFDKAFATDKTFAWSDYCIMLQCRLANKDAS